jgi:hypothetical protein
LGPVDLAVFALEGVSTSTASPVPPKFAWHFVVELLAIDAWLLKNPVPQLAVGVFEERVHTPRTALKAIISEARLAVADSLGSDLLALPVAIAGIGSAVVYACAGERTLSSRGIQGVSSLALPAVCSGVRLSAVAPVPGAHVFRAALGAFPVAEAA